MARRLLLVRHARPAGVVPGTFLGSTDAPLDPTGVVQAQRVTPGLQRRPIGGCVCSPLVRCRQTAAILAGRLPVEVDDELREIDFGRWETHTMADVSAIDPALVESWSRFDPDFAFPGGERLSDFVARVGRVATRLASHPAESLLVVTHGGVIRMLLSHYLGLEPRHYVLFVPSYLGLAVVDLIDGRGVLALDELPAGDFASPIQEAAAHA